MLAAMTGKLALGAVCAASIVASASAAAAKEFVFTGEVWSARTGEPHPDPSALQVELLSRARTPQRRGCDAREPYERKERLRVDRSGPGRFTFRVPSSSGDCTYEPLNVQFRLSGKDRDLFDPVVAYVVSEDGTLGIHERPWALIATNNREAIERWVTGHGVLRRGTHLVSATSSPATPTSCPWRSTSTTAAPPASSPRKTQSVRCTGSCSSSGAARWRACPNGCRRSRSWPGARTSSRGPARCYGSATRRAFVSTTAV